MMFLTKQQGFVLPLAIFTSAVLMLIASTLTKNIDFVFAEFVALDSAKQHLHIHEAKQKVLSMILTRAFSPVGAYPIEASGNRGDFDEPVGGKIKGDNRQYFFFDDRVYKLANGTLISIQSANGLLQLQPYNQKLRKVLAKEGYAFSTVTRFLGLLKDYVDHDDLNSLAGAEFREYMSENRLPPKNTRLISSWELRRLLGDVFDITQENAFIRLTSPYGGYININSSPAIILKSISGLNSENIKQLINQRPHASLSQASRVIGKTIPLDQLAVSTRVGRVLRITLWASEQRKAVEVYVRLFPTKDLAFEVLYQINIDLTLQEHQRILEQDDDYESIETVNEAAFFY